MKEHNNGLLCMTKHGYSRVKGSFPQGGVSILVKKITKAK